VTAVCCVYVQKVHCTVSSALHFRPDGSLSENIPDRRGQFPATTIGVEKLEISLFHMVLR